MQMTKIFDHLEPHEKITVQSYHEFGTISTEQMAKDAGQILDEFASDYKKMAKGDVFYDTIR